MNEVVTRVNNKHAYTTQGMTYPHILVTNATDAFAVLTSCLDEGDVPLYIEHNGSLHCLKRRVSPNPISLNRLLKVYPFTIVLSENVKHVISSTTELLDLGVWWE